MTQSDDDSTRARVLDLIAEKGPVSAAQLAKVLRLTPAAVRRHITALEDAEQIEVHTPAQTGKRGRGRPARHYVLTPKARTSFAEGSSDLANRALHYLSQVAGDKAVDSFAAARGRDLERRYATVVEAAGKDQWAAQEFEHVRTKPARPAKVDPWRKTPRAGSSVRSPRSLAILRELWNSREQLAAELDRTPSKVLPHQALVAAAVARPRSRRKMSALKEFSSRQARQNQERWWRAIERALELPDDELPPTRAPLHTPPHRSPAERAWGGGWEI